MGKNTRAGRVDLYVQTFLSEIYDDLELVLDLVMMRIPRIMLVGQEYESRESRSVCNTFPRPALFPYLILRWTLSDLRAVTKTRRRWK